MNEAIHIVCPHCAAVNRTPTARAGDLANCGHCHKALFTGQPVDLTEATFERHISRSDIPVVVDFWAPWCGPCKMMGPHYSEAAKQLGARARLAKVNTEAEQNLAARFGIRSIPTLALFKGGREVTRQAGAMSTADIVSWVQGEV